MPSFLPSDARALWRAFLVNATDLVDDARLLVDAGRNARATALLITAWCEIGRAMVLAHHFGPSWRLGSERALTISEDALRDGTSLVRYCRDFVVGHVLEDFWGLPAPAERSRPREAALEEAQLALRNRRWSTFVTIDPATIAPRLPSALFADDIGDDVRRTAEAIGMLLIVDRQRTGTIDDLPASLRARLPAEVAPVESDD
ncbi:MAG: AbiV family abortive infection protein [Actinomycetaceae bacterium]|nr:AbiV family abortive infection protein [Actinomycetaceae bacterium]